jgi:hypothetical protein
MNVNEIIQEILDNISEKADKNELKRKYGSKYSSFKEQYPTLFEKLFDPSFDKRLLNLMLEEKTKIDLNAISQHNASVRIGEILVDKYVKPMLKDELNE